jgi:BirA family biotin operon repressor/biotin-[acetyl-CoA-carboxylase] ligase
MNDAPHTHWQAEALWRRLEPALPGLSVEVVARAESTNSLLLERARQTGGRRSGDRQPCLLVAEHQTRGRGRQGRDWLSTRDASLTFSLALVLRPPSWTGLSLAVGVAVADALDPAPADAPPRIGLKWPNDLWRWEGPGRGRKLGGVLIETVQVGDDRMAVIGVGLNLRPQPAEGLSQGYASLDEFDSRADGPQVLARVAPPLVATLRQFDRDGLRPFLAAFARRDVLAGQPVRTLGEGALVGVADGVDETGALRVRDAQGQRAVTHGEVGVRLQDGAGC